MQHDRRPYIILPIAAFIAVLPLILRGCSCGHDFDFHIINWFEVAKQFSRGTVHPHWAFTPAWNAGEPRFVFYPPLSWVIGAALGLVMPWSWTPVAYTWLALTAAGLALHYATRSFASPNAALAAAAIYIANPYTLYTVYERSAYAELLAAAWLPLLLRAILHDRVTIPSIAIPVALLWLTNAPAAVMGCYALALLAILRLGLSLFSGDKTTLSRAQFAWSTTAGTALGLGLASFYLIPAAYERRFVQIAFAILPGLSPQENFLFHHTTDPEHDLVLHTASIVALLVVALTAAVLLLARALRHAAGLQSLPANAGKPENEQAPLLSMAALELAILFMLTPFSKFLWAYLPELRFLQFPWRLVAILAAVFALALSIALSRLSLKPVRTIASALLATAVFTVSAYLAFHQRCYPEDTLPERLSIFRSANPGTDPTDEYTPNTADNDALANANPGYWLGAVAEAPAPKDSVPGPAPLQLDLAPATPQTLILNLRNYPAWRVTLNGSSVTTRLRRDDGLIAIPVPAGPSRVEVAYATLADQSLGYLVSALSLFCLTALLLRSVTPLAPSLEPTEPSC